jgi:alpha-D-ribose 1-methylphosphonate 5-triphosphate synthase subunit PhnG
LLTSNKDRREWLHLLSKTPLAELQSSWKDANPGADFQTLRPAEVGLAMVQGRADGTGRPFNLGEATMTRCVVRCPDSANNKPLLGIGYTLGRDKLRARLIAQFDAIFQDSTFGKDLQESILPQFAKRRQSEESTAAQKVAATRVEFFTMVRGE